MSRLTEWILDLFFPNRCPCCNGFIKWNELVCRQCEEKFVSTEYCHVCGNSVCFCQNGVSTEKAFVVFDYEGAVRDGIIAIKSGENPSFAKYLGRELALQLLNDNIHADIVTFAPIKSDKRKLRGYNQSELIAKEIASAMSLPLANAFTCEKQQSSQHSLKRDGRFANAMQIDINDLNFAGKAVIFCDDITTTGSTLDRCASLLKARGAKSVIAAIGAKTTAKTDSHATKPSIKE